MKPCTPFSRVLSILLALPFIACSQETGSDPTSSAEEVASTTSSGDDFSDDERHSLFENFGENIDFADLPNYESQLIPAYITRDNGTQNPIKDEVALLGRVLFYDTALSLDDSTACASCHQQAFAFGDPEVLSQGAQGKTGRHSMRLINTRFSNEVRFFWDERAASLEEQTTMPIADHSEMGFSGTGYDPTFDDLTAKLTQTTYYPPLFDRAFGSSEVTEERMQTALAQFVRSIQSFDSKYDDGRKLAATDLDDFSNFSDEENQGKALFLAGPGLGLGCGSCHQAPNFDIDRDSRNNGLTSVANSPSEEDLSVTRSPSLRDLTNEFGELNALAMHDGSLKNLDDVIDHYASISANTANTEIDRRLTGPPSERLASISSEERSALKAFLGTLTGNNVYTDAKWSDPFIDHDE